LPGFPKFSFNFKNPFGEQVIIVGNKDTRFLEIINSFEEKTKNLSGTYSLYVLDLETGYSFGIGEDRVMQAASLIKLPVMLYSQGKVADSKIEAMGKRSDNAVFNELVNNFGKDTLQNYINELNMEKTSIEENETTPKEMGDLLRKIYDDKNEKILGYLTDTIFENWLVEGVPDEIRVAHKYGREVHVVSDGGVVYSKNLYIVVIMTQGVIEREADEIFPELSRVVYDGMNK
jgi:beta-lactamase class A